MLGTILAGWSLAPDIDHPKATAATAFGPVSRVAQKLFAGLSVKVIDWTGTVRDEPREHRGMTHALPFAALAGGGLAALGQEWPQIVISIVFAIAVGLLARLAVRWQLSSGIAVAAGAGLFLLQDHVPGPGPILVGTAAGLGCAVHIWGDWITRQGVPALAPLVMVKGKRWWNFRLPRFLTFKAGSKFENWVVGLFWVITVLAAVHAHGTI